MTLSLRLMTRKTIQISSEKIFSNRTSKGIRILSNPKPKKSWKSIGRARSGSQTCPISGSRSGMQRAYSGCKAITSKRRLTILSDHILLKARIRWTLTHSKSNRIQSLESRTAPGPAHLTPTANRSARQTKLTTKRQSQRRNRRRLRALPSTQLPLTPNQTFRR